MQFYLRTQPFIHFLNGDKATFSDYMVWRSDWVYHGESPSGTFFASARDLALLGSIMAGKGERHGMKLMSKETWEQFHSEPITKVDVAQPVPGLSPNTFTKGGVSFYDHPDIYSDKNNSVARWIREQRQGFYGWNGMGGSVFMWEPELDIGFAYVPTLMAWHDLHGMRGLKLQEQVKKCVRNIRIK